MSAQSNLSETEVSWMLDGISIHATLTRPRGEGPFPAIVFVAGSVPTDRNAETATMPKEPETPVVQAPGESPPARHDDADGMEAPAEPPDKTDPSAAMHAQGIMAYRNGDLKLALADFDRAVSMNAPLDRLGATERFYAIILEGCNNPIIAEIIQGLVARINFLRARSMSQEGRSRQSAVEMWRIFDAIENRKPEKARQAAIDHVKAAAEAARVSYDSDLGAKKEAAAAPQRRRRVSRDNAN